jgi:FKBP-type peptidyl-prolyl cis-trans isomerase
MDNAGIVMKRGRGGIRYEDIALGEGAVASRGALVEVSYDLYLNRGEQIQANQRYAFRVGGRNVIVGLEYGVEGMRVGGQRRLRIGPHLAYRDHAVPGLIPANALLDMRVTLLKVETESKDMREDV